MKTSSMPRCWPTRPTSALPMAEIAQMVVDIYHSPQCNLGASLPTDLSPAREPDLHVPRRLRDRDARQDRIHPREVCNHQCEIATHDDQPQCSSLRVLIRLVQDVAEDHRDH